MATLNQMIAYKLEAKGGLVVTLDIAYRLQECLVIKKNRGVLKNISI